MTYPSDQWRDFDLLLDRVLDGLHVEEDAIRLNNILHTDVTACQHYISYIALHGILTWRCAARVEHEDRISKNIADFWPPSPQSVAQEVSPIPRFGLPSHRDEQESGFAIQSLAPIPGLLHRPLTYISSGWPLAYLIATVVLGIGLLVGAITKISSSVQTANNLPSKADQRLTPLPTRQSVGRVTGMVDCQFSDQSTMTFPGACVLIGRKYVLSSGLIEIVYNSGAKVILQGPCNYEVTSSAAGYLSIGKLTARIEKKGEGRTDKSGEKRVAGGELDSAKNQQLFAPRHSSPTVSLAPGLPSPLFTIYTPTAIVTDLGTEFGVEVASNGRTTSYVFRGKVKISTVGGGYGLGQEMTLSENESACVEDEGKPGERRTVVRQTNVEPSRFALKLQSPETTRETSDSYGKLTLSMQPAVYYRMEPPEDGDMKVLYDSAPGRHHGAIHFADGYVDTTPYTKGRFGSSLLLRGPMLRDYAIVDDYPEATDGRLTVSAWAKATGRSEPSIIVSNWILDKSCRNQGQFVFYFSNGSRWNLAGRGSDQDGRQAIAQEGETQESVFPLGIWQHVAQVFDGTTMRVYRNGIEVASCPCRGVSPNPPVKWLSIGCEEIAWLKGKIGFWQGAIDELAIFNHALSADQIQQLYLGKPAAVAEPSGSHQESDNAVKNQ